MTIRTRLSLWFAGVLFVSLLTMSGLAYYEFVVEQRQPRSGAPGAEAPEVQGPADALTLALWCGVPAAALGLAGGWWLTTRALRPVAALTDAAARINSRRLAEQLPRTGNDDELDRLTDVFNAMTARLSDAFQRMREFTLHASHELKTPLTALHAELETALADAELSAAQRERVWSELDEVQRLTKIVDGLTLLTQADVGQLVLRREPVQLEEIVRDAAEDARNLGQSREVSVTVGPLEPLLVLGDRHRLRQLVLILVDNAVKYNHAGGDIAIALRGADQVAELTIANTGQRIRPGDEGRVFDPFFRGDVSHSHAVDGCGLGLSIARSIVDAHGGDIGIDSASVTTVTVRLARR